MGGMGGEILLNAARPESGRLRRIAQAGRPWRLFDGKPIDPITHAAVTASPR
jgi:hypothetical protein